jgi:hypothetical protein
MTMNTENTEKPTTDDIDTQRSNVTKLAFLDTAGDDDADVVKVVRQQIYCCLTAKY